MCINPTHNNAVGNALFQKNPHIITRSITGSIRYISNQIICSRKNLRDNDYPYKHFKNPISGALYFSPFETKMMRIVPSVTSQIRPKKISIGNAQG